MPKAPRRHPLPTTTTWLVALLLGGCTPNFWQLRTGVLGGEVEGNIETDLSMADGCGDLTLFAMSDDGTAVLILLLDGVLEQMHSDNHRLETLLIDEQVGVSLTLQTGQNLYSLPCYNEYYGYYSYYGYQGEGEAEVEQAFEYTAGAARLHLTARRRSWDYYDEPVHTKLTLQDVTLTDPETNATVSIPGMLVQTYIYPSWY